MQTVWKNYSIIYTLKIFTTLDKRVCAWNGPLATITAPICQKIEFGLTMTDFVVSESMQNISFMHIIRSNTTITMYTKTSIGMRSKRRKVSICTIVSCTYSNWWRQNFGMESRNWDFMTIAEHCVASLMGSIICLWIWNAYTFIRVTLAQNASHTNIQISKTTYIGMVSQIIKRTNWRFTRYILPPKSNH